MPYLFNTNYSTNQSKVILSHFLGVLPHGSVVSGLRRRSAEELLLLDDSNPCFSLRENEEQRQLLCHDRRSKFNFNPFGLRFGKRYNGYVYRRAVKRARTRSFSSPSSVSVLRPLEVEEAAWDTVTATTAPAASFDTSKSHHHLWTLERLGQLSKDSITASRRASWKPLHQKIWHTLNKRTHLHNPYVWCHYDR